MSPQTPQPQSLPLFDVPVVEPDEAGGSAPRQGERRQDGALRADPHLVEARRLSRAIRRTRNRSPEQVHTGRLICRHLVAMLRKS